MTREENINRLIKLEIAKDKEETFDTNQISDGYHTFGELYEHRIALFIALCSICQRIDFAEWAQGDIEVWRSKLHHDGSSFYGWFILGLNKEKGSQITYHLPMSYWDKTEFATTYPTAPHEWDGHTPKDVIKRLLEL